MLLDSEAPITKTDRHGPTDVYFPGSDDPAVLSRDAADDTTARCSQLCGCTTLFRLYDRFGFGDFQFGN